MKDALDAKKENPLSLFFSVLVFCSAFNPFLVVVSRLLSDNLLCKISDKLDVRKLSDEAFFSLTSFVAIVIYCVLWCISNKEDEPSSKLEGANNSSNRSNDLYSGIS